jgi:uncharacterized protein (DUF58 family)
MSVAGIRQGLARWLFRLRGPEAAPIVLVQRRIFVLPTTAGVVFALTVVLLLIGSINYLLSLGYLLTFLLAGLGIVAIVHAFRNLVRIEISPGRCEPVFVGDTAAFGLLLRNERPEDRLALRLWAQGGDVVAADAAGGRVTELRLPLPARQRGWQRLPRVTLETTYPLGLVRAWSYFQPDTRCLVYPRPEHDAPPAPYGHDGTEGRRADASGLDDFAGLRGHQPVDPPRHVAWKAVARGAPLLIKQFSGAASDVLWLDWARLPAQMDREAKLSRLTAWVLSAHAANVAFGLRLPACELPPANDPAHVERCLRELALYGQDAD